MNWKAILAGGLSVSAIAVVGIAVAGSPSSPSPAPTAVSASVSASPTAAPGSASAMADPAMTSAPADSMTSESIPAPASTPAAQPSGGVALPTSVSIPAIKAMSTLIPLGVNPDLTVQVPDVRHPEMAGWFDLGVRPGEVGSAVLLGHVDGGGTTGVFAQIGHLNLGDVISVGRADGSTANFKVTRVRTVLKTMFPSQDVYGPKPDAEIVLVTCGGTLDRAAHNYLSSVIVTGVLVS